MAETSTQLYIEDWEPVEQKPMEMAPSASFFQAKDVFICSTNRNSLCMDISIFSPQISGHLQCQQQRWEPGLGGSLQGPLHYLFLLREKRNKRTLPRGSLFLFPLPAVTLSFPGLFLPHLAECRCPTLVTTNSSRRVRRESSSSTGWKPLACALSFQQTPENLQEQGLGKEGWGQG